MKIAKVMIHQILNILIHTSCPSSTHSTVTVLVFFWNDTLVCNLVMSSRSQTAEYVTQQCAQDKKNHCKIFLFTNFALRLMYFVAFVTRKLYHYPRIDVKLKYIVSPFKTHCWKSCTHVMTGMFLFAVPNHDMPIVLTHTV